jgi:hypothetical protein
VLGLIFLLQTLHRLTSTSKFSTSNEQKSEVREQVGEGEASVLPSTDVVDLTSALDMPAGQSLGRHTRSVFTCWVIVFALVGAQMGWVLRPFIGNPAQEFEWFRERKSNFFEAVLNALDTLLTGGG